MHFPNSIHFVCHILFVIVCSSCHRRHGSKRTGYNCIPSCVYSFWHFPPSKVCTLSGLEEHRYQDVGLGVAYLLGYFQQHLQVLYIERTKISVLPSLHDLKTLQVGHEVLRRFFSVSVLVVALLEIGRWKVLQVRSTKLEERTERIRIRRRLKHVTRMESKTLRCNLRLTKIMFDQVWIWTEECLTILVPSCSILFHP